MSWHNKIDKPFPNNRGFLVYSEDEGMDLVWFDSDRKTLHVDVQHFQPNQYTYWMDIPEPPE